MIHTFPGQVGKLMAPVLTFCLQHKIAQQTINALHNSMGYKNKTRFYNYFSKLYQKKKIRVQNTIWRISFIGKQIKLPLTQDMLWLEWDTVTAILGHDVEIKQTYEYLIRSGKVSCFFDIGANYGTHSLLFLSQGIPVVSFEPNPGCVSIIKKHFSMNNLPGQVEACAVGSEACTMQLFFPENETWLGTISKETASALEKDHKLVCAETPVITLDSYVENHSSSPDLIKIDTEGFELNVLQGASQTLNRFRPLIIFEENTGVEKRKPIYALLSGAGYGLYKLPYKKPHQNKLEPEAFFHSEKTNFIAVPDNSAE